ncbi:MAG: glycoside hydrolase family 3 C-terminal domain-containing protein [Lachnospiraceae bacterium]|nr:glycoside hydrolase family 3 C-terminal domain-containing protein [Lachnospiraceae bacterium]
MVNQLQLFEKRREFLVCVDSDGCAMDTMDVKHETCFGPRMIELWGLEAHRKEIQAYWNEVNLYCMTRGINRFLGLSLVLQDVEKQYPDSPVGDLTAFQAWVESGKPLSERSLAEEIRRVSEETAAGDTVLERALLWSQQVNSSIAKLPKEAGKAFAGVREVLERIHQYADTAVVSSANQLAVEEEWTRCGLIGHIDGLFTQDAGSKKHCIEELAKLGYKPEHILMVGDAPGDLEAARANNVLFYPIRVRKEKESWERLGREGLETFLHDTYAGAYQQDQIQAFQKNLSGKQEQIGVPLEGFDAICRRAAAEGAVLLQNQDQVLPLPAGARVSIFGRAQIDYYKTGTGSGGSVNVPYTVNILEGMREQKAVEVNEELAGIYEDWLEAHPHDNGGGGWASEPLCQEEMPVTQAMAAQARACSDVAVLVIGRTAGESQDCQDTPGSLLLTETEITMLQTVCEYFEKTVVLLNVPGIMDMEWLETLPCRYPVKSVLYVWQGGMMGGAAVADLLNGSCLPSGKLTDTIARSLADYPSEANYGDAVQNRYQEDIYVGYRYFETFCPETVRYPFGYGLTYTDFSVMPVGGVVKHDGAEFVFTVAVKNTGALYAGREVVQLYVEAPQGALGKPVRSLVGFAKTRQLLPGEEQTLAITVLQKDMASYDDSGVTGHPFAWVLEAGAYHFYVGTDVRNGQPVPVDGKAAFTLDETVVLEQLESAMAPSVAFTRMRPGTASRSAAGREVYQPVYEEVPQRGYDLEARIRERLPKALPQTGSRGIRLRDVAGKTATMEAFVAQFTTEELATLVRGEGMGNPRVTPGTASAFGGVGDSLLNYGLPMACTSDGPSGIRMEGGAKATLMPTGTLLACTWDRELVEELYRYEGRELKRNQIDLLLGPGMNLHRNPRNGRNYEYYSEDPFLTGSMAGAVIRGIQSQGTYGVPKHLLCNNQEKERSFVDAVVSERALRELYLKGFEMVVRRDGAKAVMTSYNPVNGYWSASNYDLNTTVLRKQWNFDGIVMTDWWAKMNDVVEKGEAVRTTLRNMVRSQNDLYMVVSNGGAEINASGDDLLEAVQQGRLTVGELQRCACNICRFLITTPVFQSGRDFSTEIKQISAKTWPCEVKAEDGQESVAVCMNEPVYVKIAETGTYHVLASFMSEESKMAQTTSSILLNGEQLSIFQANGTKGEWVVQKVIKATIEAGIYELEVRMLKPGTVVRWLKFVKVE